MCFVIVQWVLVREGWSLLLSLQASSEEPAKGDIWAKRSGYYSGFHDFSDDSENAKKTFGQGKIVSFWYTGWRKMTWVLCEESSWVFFLSVLRINFINALNGDTFCSLDSVLAMVIVVWVYQWNRNCFLQDQKSFCSAERPHTVTARSLVRSREPIHQCISCCSRAPKIGSSYNTLWSE